MDSTVFSQHFGWLLPLALNLPPSSVGNAHAMSRLVGCGKWQLYWCVLLALWNGFQRFDRSKNCRNTQKPIWISAVLYSVNNYQHLATVLSKLNHDQVRVSLEKKPAHDVKVLTFLHLRPTFNSKSSFLFVTPSDLCLSTAAHTNAI